MKPIIIHIMKPMNGSRNSPKRGPVTKPTAYTCTRSSKNVNASTFVKINVTQSVAMASGGGFVFSLPGLSTFTGLRDSNEFRGCHFTMRSFSADRFKRRGHSLAPDQTPIGLSAWILDRDVSFGGVMNARPVWTPTTCPGRKMRTRSIFSLFLPKRGLLWPEVHEESGA